MAWGASEALIPTILKDLKTDNEADLKPQVEF